MRSSLLVAVLCGLVVFAWQGMVVHYVYAGDWTSLYCTGSRFAGPPLGERIWTFPDSYGYDGQWYHYIAHDPWFRRGFASFLDAPRIRYRRILLPGLANLLSGGQDRYVDRVYLGLVLVSVVLGSFWLSRYANLQGRSPWFGVAFLLAPSVLVSIDRLTVDIALAALCAGFVWFLATNRKWPLYVLLLAALLVRETGLLLLAGYVFTLLLDRQFGRALLFSTAALPTIGWYWFISAHTPPDPVRWFHELPLAGFVRQILHPNSYSLTLPASAIATFLDYAALAGAVLAIGWAFVVLRRKTVTPVTIAIYAFASLAICLELDDFWMDAFGFGRVLTPLLLLLALESLHERRPAMALPMLMVTSRIAVLSAALGLRVAKAIL